MRRAELERAGIQLPVLPTIVLGGLPGGAPWAERLERLGLDVVASGAAADDPGTWAAVRAAVPFRPAKARCADAAALAALAAAGCRLAEAPAGATAEGVYVLGDADTVLTAVDASSVRVEEADAVGGLLLGLLEDEIPAAAWVAAGPGLEGLPADVVEGKLAALVEGARRARLHLAKHQFDL